MVVFKSECPIRYWTCFKVIPASKHRLPHVHYGYNHEEYEGTQALSSKDIKIVEKAVNSWYNRSKK